MFCVVTASPHFKIDLFVVDIDFGEIQKEDQVLVYPKLSIPFSIEINGGITAVIIIINLMVVTKVQDKGLPVHKNNSTNSSCSSFYC